MFFEYGILRRRDPYDDGAPTAFQLVQQLLGAKTAAAAAAATAVANVDSPSDPHVPDTSFKVNPRGFMRGSAVDGPSPLSDGEAMVRVDTFKTLSSPSPDRCAPPEVSQVAHEGDENAISFKTHCLQSMMGGGAGDMSTRYAIEDDFIDEDEDPVEWLRTSRPAAAPAEDNTTAANVAKKPRSVFHDNSMSNAPVDRHHSFGNVKQKATKSASSQQRPGAFHIQRKRPGTGTSVTNTTATAAGNVNGEQEEQQHVVVLAKRRVGAAASSSSLAHRRYGGFDHTVGALSTIAEMSTIHQTSSLSPAVIPCDDEDNGNSNVCYEEDNVSSHLVQNTDEIPESLSLPAAAQQKRFVDAVTSTQRYQPASVAVASRAADVKTGSSAIPDSMVSPLLPVVDAIKRNIDSHLDKLAARDVAVHITSNNSPMPAGAGVVSNAQRDDAVSSGEMALQLYSLKQQVSLLMQLVSSMPAMANMVGPAIGLPPTHSSSQDFSAPSFRSGQRKKDRLASSIHVHVVRDYDEPVVPYSKRYPNASAPPPLTNRIASNTSALSGQYSSDWTTTSHGTKSRNTSSVAEDIVTMSSWDGSTYS